MPSEPDLSHPGYRQPAGVDGRACAGSRPTLLAVQHPILPDHADRRQAEPAAPINRARRCRAIRTAAAVPRNTGVQNVSVADIARREPGRHSTSPPAAALETRIDAGAVPPAGEVGWRRPRRRCARTSPWWHIVMPARGAWAGRQVGLDLSYRPDTPACPARVRSRPLLRGAHETRDGNGFADAGA